MLDDFLNESALAGQNQGKGSFTISPERARVKLAESVPPSLRDPWIAAALLLDGLELGFSWTVTQGLPIMLSGALMSATEGGIDLWLTGKNCPETIASAFEVLKNVGEHPFSSSEPAELSLSRGLLALTHLGISCHIRVGRSELAWPCQGTSDDLLLVLAKDRPFGNAFGRISLGPHQTFTHYYNQGSKYRPSTFSLTDPHRRVTKKTIWRESQGVGLKLQGDFGDWHTGSWYDYRTRAAVLLESFHHGPKDSQRLLIRSSTQAPGTFIRVNEQKSAWQRFISRRDHVFLRQWGEHPPEPDAHDNEKAPLRAIFSIGLSDRPSVVRLLGWTQVGRDLILPNTPYGLRGQIWWPELKQSLYGEQWVEDEEYDKALVWVRQQVRTCFLLLEQEFDYIIKEILNEYTRRAYTNEVIQKLLDWRQNIQRYLHPQS